MFKFLKRHESSKVAAKDRVSLPQKLAYGAGGFVNPFIDFSQGWMMMFYTQAFGINPAVISSVGGLFRAWDAINDPLIGSMSDNCRSRFGRRRPFIFVGGILFAFSIPLLWAMNPDWSDTAKIIYMIIAGLILYTTGSIWSLPHQALVIEMTSDTNERTRILGVKTYFAYFAGAVSEWMPKLAALSFFAGPVLADGTDNIAQGLLNVSLALAVLIAILAILPAIFCHERFYEKGLTERQEKVPILRSMKQTFTNQPFMCLLIMMLTQVVGALLVGNLGFFVIRYYVCNGDYSQAALVFGSAGTMSLLFALGGVPFWVWFSERFGKKQAIALVMFFGILSKILIYFFYIPGDPWMMLVPQVFVAFSGAALWMIMPSMLGDVVDYDELKHGARREGVFSAVFLFCVKCAVTIATVCSGFILVYVGFDEDSIEQSMEMARRLRDWYVFLPIVLWTFAFFLIFRYPISAEKAREVRVGLEERRGEI